MEKTVTDYFLSLIKIDSESRDELKVALRIKDDLEKLGAKVLFDNAHQKTGGNVGNLCAFMPGNEKLEPVMLCAHMDTVVPGRNINPQIKDGVIRTDGTTILGADDKSGVAEIVWGIKELKESGNIHPPIEILFTISEEIGLLGVKNCDLSPFKAKTCFTFDSHEVGSITNGAPSQNNIKIIVHGKKAHAGVEPETGINAILVASEAITKVKMGRIDKETTANIGIIEGGKATNIIPDVVSIKGESRSHSEKKLQKVTDDICEVFKNTAKKYRLNDFSASVDIKVTNSYTSFYVDKSDIMVKIAKKINKKLGLPSPIKKGGGGSDANILNQKGIKSIVIGSGMKNPHTTEESITITSLEDGAKWVKELLIELGKVK